MDESVKPISHNEEKELQRVFNVMCNYAAKSKLQTRLEPKRKRREKIVAHRKSPEAVVVLSEAREVMAEADINNEFEALKAEIAALEAETQAMEGDPTRKIKVPDLSECLKVLGNPTARKEIEEMVWEVDENLDGLVDWEEFKLTYQRNLADSTGLEPCQLFNLIQFMLYDKDGSGKVTIDETMHMLYTRYGKDRLEGVRSSLALRLLGGQWRDLGLMRALRCLGSGLKRKRCVCVCVC